MFTGWGGLRAMIPGLKKKADPLADWESKKCFSILFTNGSSLHMELPPGGNGR